MQKTAGPLAEGRLASNGLAVTLVVLVAGFCSVVGLMLVQLRHDSYDRALVGADNLLAAICQDIARNVELFDLSLQAVVAGLKLPGVGDLSTPMRQAVLFDRAATADYLDGILVLNEKGDVTDDVSISPPRPENFSDRAYFKYHATSPETGLTISKPFVSRLNAPGKHVLAFSRRLEHPDGSFAGVVVGVMRLDYFKDLFNRFQLGENGSLNLFNKEGILLMRAPYVEADIGRDLSHSKNVIRFLQAKSGRFEGVAALDGVKRIYTFSHIGELPLMLSLAFSESDVYATWRSRALIITAVLTVLCAATGALGIMVRGEMRRRAAAEARTALSESHYRLLADNATDVIVRFGPDMRRQYVSPACASVLGYSPSEYALLGLGETTHPDDWPATRIALLAAQDGRTHCQLLYRVRHKAGHDVWMEARYSFVPDDGGFIAVLRDVSARRRAEQELEAAHAQLLHLATTDGLTGLANRRSFDEALEQEWQRAARTGTPLTVLMLDVDRFKMFNDRYGHQAGDACLRTVAQAMAGCAHRPGDLVARYGGEEFVMLLPDTVAVGGLVVAEAARDAVAALGLGHADNPDGGGTVTISVGLSTVLPAMWRSGNHPAFAGPDALVAAADRALYRAKTAGRNRAEMGEVLPPAPLPDCEPGQPSEDIGHPHQVRSGMPDILRPVLAGSCVVTA